MSKPLILIADDDEFVRLIYRNALAEAGYETVEAADGAAALANFTDLRPQLVLLDLVMPIKDGFTACREIRSLEGNQYTPVLMITSCDDLESIHRAFEAGATDFITKPINPELLVYRVHYMLRASHSIKSLATSEAILANSQRVAQIGHWEWNPLQGTFWGSKEACRILGLENVSQILPFESFLAVVYAADRVKVELAMKPECIDNTPCKLEFRIKRPDSDLRLVRLLGQADDISLGRASKMVGTLQDISEKKQLEEQYSIIKKAIDSLPIGITITDVHGKIIYSNPAEAEIHGYTVEEIENKYAHVLAPAELRQTVMPEDLYRFGTWKRESINIRKNGVRFPVQLSSIAIKNSEGDYLGVVSACEDISRRKDIEEKLYQLAYFDTLTGLPNRQTFLDRLQQALASANREKSRVGLLFIDLDNFKDINDTKGHCFGDKLLQEVAERLAGHMRRSDTLARIGGDEFTVVMTMMENQESTANTAQRILSLFSQPFKVEGQLVFIGVSIGIALFPDDGIDAEILLQCADMALYQAKSEGKHNYTYYSREMNEKNVRRMAFENSLHHALERQEFSLQYQPQWDLLTGRIVGAEALLRWQSPELNYISPAEFVNLAEKSGQIIELGHWVLRAACTKAWHWAKSGYPELMVAVNISGKQLKHPDFMKSIAQLIQETRINPERLELEFTESILMEKSEQIINALKNLKKLGVQLSIDEFGMGYSSLSYLRHFHIDKIKIDRSFITNVLRDDDDAKIVRSIIYMAHSLDLKVVAVGVENKEQLQFLADCQCDLAQGFYLSVPMDSGELDLNLKRIKEDTGISIGTET
jgi:diguanylate cyclase (GGDEF)-like protein/PAS domain S-box-containing protein